MFKSLLQWSILESHWTIVARPVTNVRLTVGLIFG